MQCISQIINFENQNYYLWAAEMNVMLSGKQTMLLILYISIRTPVYPGELSISSHILK